MRVSRGGPPLVLYSTNTLLKFKIQERYRGEHHVWCSPAFEAAALGRYAPGAGTPPSSDPASIYRHLHRAVKACDDHDAKIAEQKAVLLGLAVKWCADGNISDTDREDITAMVTAARFPDWTPLLFVIPYFGVVSRLMEERRHEGRAEERRVGARQPFAIAILTVLIPGGVGHGKHGEVFQAEMLKLSAIFKRREQFALVPHITANDHPARRLDRPRTEAQSPAQPRNSQIASTTAAAARGWGDSDFFKTTPCTV
jgi:hypothetical protein